MVEGTDSALVFNTDTGKLFFDQNGEEAGGRQLVAVLTNGADLTAGNFFIV